ncbi:MAG: hypothetical protein AB7L65_03975 [Hyphomonadaceae bacterium]
MWTLRWPAALLLLVLATVSLVGAGAVTAARLDAPQLADLSERAVEYGRSATWLQAGMMYAAALMFFISMVRLLRRTQAFWYWLLGFGLFGASWALTHNIQQWGALAQTMPRFDALTSQNAAEIFAQALDQGLAPLAACLLAGLAVAFVDGADRAHWDRHGQ